MGSTVILGIGDDIRKVPIIEDSWRFVLGWRSLATLASGNGLNCEVMNYGFFLIFHSLSINVPSRDTHVASFFRISLLDHGSLFPFVGAIIYHDIPQITELSPGNRTTPPPERGYIPIFNIRIASFPLLPLLDIPPQLHTPIKPHLHIPNIQPLPFLQQPLDPDPPRGDGPQELEIVVLDRLPEFLPHALAVQLAGDALGWRGRQLQGSRDAVGDGLVTDRVDDLVEAGLADGEVGELGDEVPGLANELVVPAAFAEAGGAAGEVDEGADVGVGRSVELVSDGGGFKVVHVGWKTFAAGLEVAGAFLDEGAIASEGAFELGEEDVDAADAVRADFEVVDGMVRVGIGEAVP